MASECSGRRELPEFVSDHVFSDINRNKLISVMNCDGVTDEIRRDHTCT